MPLVQKQPHGYAIQSSDTPFEDVEYYKSKELEKLFTPPKPKKDEPEPMRPGAVYDDDGNLATYIPIGVIGIDEIPDDPDGA